MALEPLRLNLGEGSKSLLRRPVSLSKGRDVLQIAAGTVLILTRFSLVRFSTQDLAPEKSLLLWSSKMIM